MRVDLPVDPLRRSALLNIYIFHVLDEDSKRNIIIVITIIM